MNMLSSVTGPAVMPSGGSLLSVRYSWKRRLEATLEAMAVLLSAFACLSAQRRWFEMEGACSLAKKVILLVVDHELWINYEFYLKASNYVCRDTARIYKNTPHDAE